MEIYSTSMILKSSIKHFTLYCILQGCFWLADSLYLPTSERAFVLSVYSMPILFPQLFTSGAHSSYLSAIPSCMP